MPDTNEQIDPVKEARELLANATPHPWATDGTGIVFTKRMQTNYNTLEQPAVAACRPDLPFSVAFVDSARYDVDVEAMYQANATLIARAPELIKTLCDEVDRLRTIANEAAGLGCLRGRRVHCAERETDSRNWCVSCQAQYLVQRKDEEKQPS